MASLRQVVYRSSAITRSFASTSRLGEAAKSPLEIRLRDGLKTAMKSKDKAAVTTHKSILADILNTAKQATDPNAPLPENAVISTIRKGISSRVAIADIKNTAAESYAPGTPSQHPENHSNLLEEIKLLQSYLPTAPSADTISTSIEEIIGGLEESVRTSKGVQGVVMKSLWEKLGDAAGGVDRKEIGKLVADALKK